MTIAVYARSTKDNDARYIEQISGFLRNEKIGLIVYKPYYEYLCEDPNFKLKLDTFSTSEELVSKADYVISLGGDGTMLETLVLVRKSGTPVLGVNTGRLGFLASVNKTELKKALKKLVKQRFTLDKRELIELLGSKDCFDSVNYALNEFTILKKDSSSMISIDTFIDGVFLNSYFADGLIVSTSTGSTAYSLSCGGPIMVPDSGSFIITPIAPHNLNVRPIIIPNNKTVSFKISGRSDSFIISLDSRTSVVSAGTEVSIRKADFSFNMIQLEGQHFFTTLRNKLMWGLDKRH
jgi:NAD+ kinase